MSYVLDGIQTAMVETQESAGGYSNGSTLSCPCGWHLWDILGFGDRSHEPRAALRFHYSNCPMAKLDREGE